MAASRRRRPARRASAQALTRVPDLGAPRWRHRIEGWLVAALFALLRAARVTTASNVAGALARLLGPRLPVSRIAERNLVRAMPELDRPARRRIIAGVWDNVGRTAAELPHLATLRRISAGTAGPGVEFADDARLATLRAAGGPAMFFSAHIANWEVILPFASHLGLPVSGLYRAASNPLVDRIIGQSRRQAMLPGTKMFPKGAVGARGALKHLSQGGFLGLLVDQKMNDGIEVPFFGRPAMTAPALASFALRFRCPVIPVQILRLGPARFRVIWEQGLVLPDTGDRTADVAALMATVNAVVERWVRAEPQSWLWLHRRWVDSGKP